LREALLPVDPEAEAAPALWPEEATSKKFGSVEELNRAG